MNQLEHGFGKGPARELSAWLQPVAGGTGLQRVARAITAIVARWTGATERPQAGAGEGQWIRPRHPLVLGRSDRRTLTCDAGTVWITQGDRADYILEAGQSLALQPADEVVVTAMAGPARIHEMRQQAARAAGTNGGP